jgi:two-component system, NtrC family, sensor kinase
VPLSLLTVIASRNARKLLAREATNSLLAIAERQSRELETYITERERTVAALSRTPSVGEALRRSRGGLMSEEAGAELDGKLRDFFAHFEESSVWDDAILVTVPGDVIFSAGGSPAVGTNLRTGPHAGSGLALVCERALMTMGTEISELRQDSTAGVPASYVATPVLDDGIVVGVLALRMSNTEVQRVVNDWTGLGRTGETIVTARDKGDAVFLTPVRHDPEAAFQRRVPLSAMDGSRGSELVRGRIRAGRAVDYRGQKVLAVYSDVPHLRWQMMVKIDEKEAFAPIARFRLLSALVEVPLFALVVLAALSIARTISGPIARLTDATRAFSAGDLSRRAHLETHNEIRLLSASFNQMGAKLQSSIAELERYSRTLEGRVRDRTKELEEKNAQLQSALESLGRAQEQILLQEKMASLGSLTAGIAHEIKNPLNFVNNFALLTGELVTELDEGLVKEKEKLDPRSWEDIEALMSDLKQNAAKIREHGKRADGIVKSMLLHARGRTGERQATDVNSLVSETMNLAYHAMRGQDPSFNIKLQPELDPKAGAVDAVPQDLSRVFLNLMNNAMYATHEKKKAAGGDYAPLLDVRTKSLGDAVEVRVKDNGNGIPKAVLDKVFAPFFTTKPAGSGTGLGLSISYDIVTAGHGGTLEVNTEEGRYAEFVVTLPRVPAAKAQKAS